MNEKLRERLFSAPGGNTWRELLESFPALQVYVAGGCVRDEIIARGRTLKDLDLFIGGNSIDDALQVLANSGRLTRGPFGSPRWFPHADRPFYYDVIPIDRFRNGLWPCKDIVDVLNQFDFTANAVALDIRNGVFFDPQNGMRDAHNREMRAIRFDYPDEPISDSLSFTRPTVVWFRILHYAAALDFSIESVTSKWLRAHAHLASQSDEFESVFFSLHPRWRNGLETC